jgi:hypothetical protein
LRVGTNDYCPEGRKQLTQSVHAAGNEEPGMSSPELKKPMHSDPVPNPRHSDAAVGRLPPSDNAALPLRREARLDAGLIGLLEKRVLFVMSALLFVGLSLFTVIAYRSEATFYSEILNHARKAGTCAENVMAFEVALAPFRSLAIVRTAALFLSFVLVLLGSLFVLTGIEVAYRMSLELGEKKAALETASPGLVLVTAGALLVAASLYRGGSPEFRPIPCGQANAVSKSESGKPVEQLNPKEGTE